MNTARIGILQIGIIGLTLATALIHLTLSFPDPMFILNGLGYLTLLAGLFLPIAQLASYRPRIRWALATFAGVTILGWLAIGMRTPLGYTAKTIEVILIVLLFIDARQK
jgi:hypothetical protein